MITFEYSLECLSTSILISVTSILISVVFLRSHVAKEIIFNGVVGMGLLWTILILNLIVPAYTGM